MPRVSVLMPIYKTNETHLREAIESILTQTFKDYEFLILDDCPDDDREEIVKSYKDERIKYSKNEENLGITRSRNKLIDMAQGEYLAIFDHDDVSLPMRLQKEVEYLDENQDVGVVSCWVDCFPHGQGMHLPSDDIRIKALLTDICAVVHPASMIRKSVLEKNNLRYEEEFTPCEDYRLWLRLIDLTRFHNIQEVLFKYRLHDTNTSKIWRKQNQNITKILHMWVRSKHPFLYRQYIEDRTHQLKVELLGIPFFKIIANQEKIKIYLFGIIRIITIRRKVLWLEWI